MPLHLEVEKILLRKPWFLQQYAPTLDSPEARLKLPQITQKLGPDNQKIKPVKCQPRFLFNTFSSVTAFIFFFDFQYNWHLLFRFFFSTRSHQAVECPALASFQPSEFHICLCQRENGAFSYRYFSFHWWKESLWFIGDVLSFIITADTAEGKDKLLSTQPYSGTSLWEKILLPAWSTLNRMWMSTS